MSDSFGTLARRLRKEQGLSLRAVAKKLGGVSFSYLSQLENDRATPSEDLARRIAKTYGANEEALVFVARKVSQTIDELKQKYPKMTQRYFTENKK